MKQRTHGTTVAQRVLVTSDQNGFSRDLIARWQMQPQVPEFTALSSDLLRSGPALPFDVAMVGDVKPERTDLSRRRSHEVERHRTSAATRQRKQ